MTSGRRTGWIDDPEVAEEGSPAADTGPPGRRANRLDGQAWTRNSISVWSDIRKNDEERRLAKDHPALFPQMLVQRVMESFMTPDDRTVLDPFAGIGSTVVAADRAGFTGIGFELYREYADKAAARVANVGLFDANRPPTASTVYCDSASRLRKHLKRNSVDFVFTSPPYWDVLSRRRTADYRPSREYGQDGEDLGAIPEYEAFLDALIQTFREVSWVLRPNGYCIVNVMDLRKQSKFYPLHADLAARLAELGFEWDDLIIWDRRHEYNNMRPLGYPTVFRINKAHEYLLVFINRK